MEKERLSTTEKKVVCHNCFLEAKIQRLEKLEEEYYKLRHDKAELLHETRRLKRELQTDELTGLKKTICFEKLCFTAMNNHAKKKSSFRSSMMKERREETHYFVVFIDLDGLKMANDTSPELGGGRETGNCLLRALANTLQKRTRKDDVVARYAGSADEFGVFLTGSSFEKAEQSIERIRRHFEENAKVRFPVLSQYFEDRRLKISFSYGIQEIFVDYSEEEIRNVIARADALMHTHKERRKQDRHSMQVKCSTFK